MKEGVKLVEVTPYSKAWNNGLRKNDIITQANRVPVRDIIALIKASKGHQSLLLNVQRGNSAFFLIIR